MTRKEKEISSADFSAVQNPVILLQKDIWLQVCYIIKLCAFFPFCFCDIQDMLCKCLLNQWPFPYLTA